MTISDPKSNDPLGAITVEVNITELSRRYISAMTN